MAASKLIKICALAIILTVTYATPISVEEAALITLGDIVRQDATDKNNSISVNGTDPLPTAKDSEKNGTEKEDPDKKEMADKEDKKDKKEEMDKDGDKKPADSSNGTSGGNSTSDGSSTGPGSGAGANAGEGNNNTAAPCFPGTAMVTLEGGAQVRMMDLSIGDKVAVGNGKFSEVFMFTHRLSDVRYEFVELHTSNGNALRATAGHYVYASGKYVAAGGVQIGDTLELADGARTDVTEVKKVVDVGLYNPQTSHGDIIVNGVRASTYTTAIESNFAHAALSPLRAIFARLGMACTAFESGADIAVKSLPSGSVVA